MQKGVLAKAAKLILAGALLSLSAFAGTVTGKVALANTSVPLKNATLTYTLSQAGYVSGSFLVVPDSVSCYTTVDGSITGMPDPRVLPVVTADTASGSLTAGNYDVAISYYDATTETLVSSVRTINLSGTGRLIVTAPVLQPATATGYRVYIALTGTTVYRQTSVVGWGNYTQSTVLVAVTPASATNTSACTLRFNDELIPSSTGYDVNIVNVSGSQISGFPMRWYLYGGSSGTINVSNGYPTSKATAIYPQPLLLNPPTNVQQSVSSPITLNGYAMTAGYYISTVATGTVPLQVTSTTPVPNFTPQRLNSTTTVNTANAVTEVWTNPTAPRTYTHPDFGGPGFYVLSSTANTVDCTSALTCNFSTIPFFDMAASSAGTAAVGLNSFSTNNPVAISVSRTNTVKGAMQFQSGGHTIQWKTNSAAASATVTTTYTVPASSLLVAVVHGGSGTTVSGCTDTVNAYTQFAAARSVNGATDFVDVWYKLSSSVATGVTLTCTVAAGTNLVLDWYEIQGMAGAAADGAGVATGTSTAPSVSSSGATTGTHGFTLAAVVSASTPTITGSTGYVQGATVSSTITGQDQVKLTHANAIVSGSWTLSASNIWASTIVSFKTAGTTTVHAQKRYKLPADWNASATTPISISIGYRTAFASTDGTSVAGVLGVAAGCHASGADDDPAFNAAVTATAFVPTVANTRQTATFALSGSSLTGCAAGNIVVFDIQRVIGNSSDTSPISIDLLDGEITIQRSQ